MAARAPRSEQEKTPTNLEKADSASPNSFLGKIIMAMNKVTTDLARSNPDAKNNTGQHLGEMYMWDEIAKYAKGRSDMLWENAERDKFINTTELAAGQQHVLTTSPHFVCSAIVTQPVRRFDPTVLANWFLAKYKVPIMVTKEQIELAKVLTKPMVKLNIAEKTGGA